jgi:hypothetical protein
MLFCLTANYTPKALEAMGKNLNTSTTLADYSRPGIPESDFQ